MGSRQLTNFANNLENVDPCSPTHKRYIPNVLSKHLLSISYLLLSMFCVLLLILVSGMSILNTSDHNMHLHIIPVAACSHDLAQRLLLSIIGLNGPSAVLFGMQVTVPESPCAMMTCKYVSFSHSGVKDSEGVMQHLPRVLAL